MKRFLLITIVTAACAGAAFAQGFKIGGHGSYSIGGDIEDESFGYGAQVVFAATENISLELSGTWFEDEDVGTTFDITHIAATLRLGAPLQDGVFIYGGAGGNYNMVDIERVGDKLDDEVGYHFCGGLEMEISEGVELFGEYRYSFITLDEEDYGIDEEDFEVGLIRVGLNLVL